MRPLWDGLGLRDITVTKWLVLLAQLTAICAIILVFRVEEQQGLTRLLPVIFGGFVLHSVAPRRFRLPVFLVLSLVAFLMVLGRHAGVFFGFAAALIGICHLPLRLRYRVVLLTVFGVGLAVLRLRWESLTASLVLPVLGSVFAFRLAIYLYDIEHERTPSSWWERLSYFLLLPNPFFLFFPVVDFANFRRSYYKGDAGDIYQKGLHWIFRGTVQLLLYRLVYHRFTPSPSGITDFWGVLLFILSSYLLYIRVSGQFHLIAGILCLFGFNLPETHHNYYLASSFSDLWRRINIYWKDFMMKLFFYPVFMRLRRLGNNTALVLSTAVVFVSTWLLHSYQWLWLRAEFPITGVDTLFWGVLGLLVTLNTLREAKSVRSPRSGSLAFSWSGAFRLSFQTLAMFTFMAVLWSLWSSSSVSEWVAVISVLQQSGVSDWFSLAAILGGVGVVGTLVQFRLARGRAAEAGLARAPVPALSPGACMATAAVLVPLGFAGQTAGMFPQVIPVIQVLKADRLNSRDQEAAARGYYETLLEPSRFTRALWTRRLPKPKDWEEKYYTEIARRPSGKIVTTELRENVDSVYFRVRFQTNAWGMHDRPYEQAKPPDVLRIALLGASYEMGPGVEVNQTYENRVEAALNQAMGSRGRRIEILNFGMSAYSILDNHYVFHHRALTFSPDVVIYVDHLLDDVFVVERLKETVDRGILVPANIESLLRKAEIQPGMNWVEVKRRFAPYTEELFALCAREIAGECRRRGVLPVWLYVPSTDETAERRQRLGHHRSRAEEAGFVFIGLESAYGGEAGPAVQLAPWDTHPNVRGHRLIAERMFVELVNHPTIGPLLKSEGDTSNRAQTGIPSR